MRNMEEFRWVKGLEGFYQISNKGEVYSFPRHDNLMRVQGGKLMKTAILPNGYEVAYLSKSGKRYAKYVHKMVAEAFIPNPQNKPEIDHIDTNKLNNNVENLRWCTRKENISNPLSFSAMKIAVTKNASRGARSPFSRKVGQYSLDGTFIAEYESAGMASLATGVSVASIQSCAIGKRNRGGQFIWKYLSEPKMKHNIVEHIGRCGKPVLQLDKAGNFIAEYVSIGQASRKTGIDASSIAHCVKGRYKSFKGYVWKLKELD